MKCVYCKNCIGYENGYYICKLGQFLEAVEECIANDENMSCDMYVEDDHDDITKRA